jgi:hypothetical protein
MMPTLIAGDDITGADINLVFPGAKFSIPVAADVATALNTGINANTLTLPANVSLSGNNLVYSMPAKVADKPIQMKGLIPAAVPMLAFPIPTLQLGIGLVKSTDLIIRWIPKQDISGFKFGLWGLAVKHDFKQWIPVVKDLPLDATVLLGYTKFSSSYDISVTPDMYGDVQIVNPNSARWDNQELALGSSAFTANFIISKNLLFVTPYIGFGFTYTSFDLAMKGNYPLLKAPITDPNDPNFINPLKIPNATEIASAGQNVTLNDQFGKLVVDSKVEAKKVNGKYTSGDYMKDPINITPTNFMPNATLGVRFKVLILTMHAQYTFQQYSMFSAGLGFSFR